MQLSMAQVQMGASYAVAGKAMEAAEVQAEQLLEMLTQIPSFGHSLDIRI